MTVAYYVGAPGTGKTTLMCDHALQKARERGVPAILLDSEGVVGKDKFPGETARNLEDLVERVWNYGRDVRFHPRGADDVALLSAIARNGKDCVLLVDEISYWGRGASPVPELARLYRVHRHSRLDLYATSQYPGDISPLIWNIRSDTFVFRNDSLRALERLEEELRLGDDEARAIPGLPDLSYLHFRTGVVRAEVGPPLAADTPAAPEALPSGATLPPPAEAPGEVKPYGPRLSFRLTKAHYGTII